MDFFKLIGDCFWHLFGFLLGTYLLANFCWRLNIIAWCWYLKQYPLKRNVNLLVPAHFLHKPSPSTIRRWISLVMGHLDVIMCEISEEHFDWEDNHCPHFPEGAVGFLDTLPVYCYSSDHTYQGKYQSHCVKFSLWVSIIGMIGFFSGPHKGNRPMQKVRRKICFFHGPGLSHGWPNNCPSAPATKSTSWPGFPVWPSLCVNPKLYRPHKKLYGRRSSPA